MIKYLAVCAISLFSVAAHSFELSDEQLLFTHQNEDIYSPKAPNGKIAFLEYDVCVSLRSSMKLPAIFVRNYSQAEAYGISYYNINDPATNTASTGWYVNSKNEYIRFYCVDWMSTMISQFRTKNPNLNNVVIPPSFIEIAPASDILSYVKYQEQKKNDRENRLKEKVNQTGLL